MLIKNHWTQDIKTDTLKASETCVGQKKVEWGKPI